MAGNRLRVVPSWGCLHLRACSSEFRSSICRDKKVRVSERDLSVDLIVMDFLELDVLLGIDWLTRHGAVIDCPKRQVQFRTPSSVPCELLGDSEILFPLCRPCRLGTFWKRAALDTLRQSPATQLPQWRFRRSQLYPATRLTCFQLARITTGERDLLLYWASAGYGTYLDPYRMAPAELKEFQVQLDELRPLLVLFFLLYNKILRK